MTTLLCSKCKVQKDVSMFHKCNNKRGFKYYCKNCIKEHTPSVPGVPTTQIRAHSGPNPWRVFLGVLSATVRNSPGTDCRRRYAALGCHLSLAGVRALWLKVEVVAAKERR